MITPKHVSLRDILNSKGGLHLTAYVRAGSDIAGTRLKLSRVLYFAINQMHQCTNPETRREFLSPLVSLIGDNRRIETLPRRFAVFLNGTSFRIISLPNEVEEQCFVADSFHVKPVLGWIQADEDLLVLTLEGERATLYAGTRGQIRLVSEFQADLFAGANATRSRKLKRARAEWADEVSNWMEDQLSALPRGHRPRLYLLGGQAPARQLATRLRYRSLDLSLSKVKLAGQSMSGIWSLVQKRQSAETKNHLKLSLKEFQRADRTDSGRRNLFEIATEAAQGRVSKLLIASDLQIFGKVDQTTGTLRVSGADIDHEDDDILDDLAQMVLAKGGKVHVVPAASIPRAVPAFALLRDSGNELSATSDRIVPVAGDSPRRTVHKASE